MLRRLCILLSLFLASCASNSCEADGIDSDSQNQTELITNNADLGTMHSDSKKTASSDILIYNYPGIDNNTLSYFERGLFWFNVPDGTQSKKIRFLYQANNSSIPIFLADDATEDFETCQDNLNLLEKSFSMSCSELAKELGWVIMASGTKVEALKPEETYEERALNLLKRTDVFYYSCSVLGSESSTAQNVVISGEEGFAKLKCD